MEHPPRLYVWQSTFALGIPEVDQEHERFLDIINLLYAAVIAGDSERELRLTWQRLEAFAVQHFGTEERLFAATGYPGADEHRKLHAEFLRDLGRMTAAEKSARATITFLRDWLLAHMLRADKKFARWLESSGVKVPESNRRRTGA